ncbi:MAG: cytidylate kinase family protein [Deltaproteobacteria bacterium]|nr:cytidylate kinase family protein [Deltaproteobacteria bacterium]MBW2085161.1 cytidylate kinase family protein [Deltaproteobacteria bacterium]
MAVITISRGSYSRGKEVAEKAAQKLGYECIVREILLEASEEFHIPEIKLLHAIEDAPSIFNRFTYGKEKYIAYIQAALLKHLQKDNVVYHGFAGHFFVKDIPHVLKVRIIADIEDRVEIVMERDEVSRKEALHFLKKIDAQRRKWSRDLYGIDTWDPILYDLVLHIHNIRVDEAVDIICHTIGLKHFQTTAESQKAMDDLTLSAEVKAALIDTKPDIEVTANNGLVYIKTEAPLEQEPRLVQKIEKITKTIPGVKEINIQVLPHYTV